MQVSGIWPRLRKGGIRESWIGIRESRLPNPDHRTPSSVMQRQIEQSVEALLQDDPETDGLISALALDGAGGAREVGWEAVRAWTAESGVLWVHLNRLKEDAEHYIRAEAGL